MARRKASFKFQAMRRMINVVLGAFASKLMLLGVCIKEVLFLRSACTTKFPSNTKTTSTLNTKVASPQDLLILRLFIMIKCHMIHFLGCRTAMPYIHHLQLTRTIHYETFTVSTNHHLKLACFNSYLITEFRPAVFH